MNTKAILQQARDYLAEPGNWIQGVMTDGGNRVCALGSVNRLSVPHGERLEASFALEKSLPTCWPRVTEKGEDMNRLLSVARYNDAEGRTVEDVLALFDYAIKGERMPSPGEAP